MATDSGRRLRPARRAQAAQESGFTARRSPKPRGLEATRAQSAWSDSSLWLGSGVSRASARWRVRIRYPSMLKSMVRAVLRQLAVAREANSSSPSKVARCCQPSITWYWMRAPEPSRSTIGPWCGHCLSFSGISPSFTRAMCTAFDAAAGADNTPRRRNTNLTCFRPNNANTSGARVPATPGRGARRQRRARCRRHCPNAVFRPRAQPGVAARRRRRTAR